LISFIKKRSNLNTNGIKVINPDGIPFTLEYSFECSIKMEYEDFKNAREDETKKILTSGILRSLASLEKVRSRLTRFDWASFQVDLEGYFRDQKFEISGYCITSKVYNK
jgi:hypothetical protein